MSVIVPIDMPVACNDCPFLSKPEEIPVGDWMYTKICSCTIAPKEIEETYHKLHWLANNKPEWCPLKEGEQTMPNCKNCIHNAVCDMASRFVEAFADNNGICIDYKDKSSLIERKALYDKVEELLIGHGYINPDTAILECLEIIENFPTADVERERAKETDDERKTD